MALVWAIIGAGKISHDYVCALNILDSKHHSIRAIASKNLDRAKYFAAVHRISEAYGNYDAIAQHPGINAVYIGNVNSLHYDTAKLMLEHGKAVLCEKPLCMTTAQTQSLVNIAREKKVFLMEGFWSRFFPIYNELRNIIDSRVLGDIKMITADLGFALNEIDRLWNPLLGAGCVRDLGVYTLQFVQFVLRGRKPIEIVANGIVTQTLIDEYAHVTLRFAGGITAILSCSARNNLQNSAEIIGTNGFIQIPDFWCPTTLTGLNRIRTIPLPSTSSPLNFHNSSGLTYEAEEVRKCIAAGLIESPSMPLEESLELARWRDIILAQLGVH